MNLLKLFKVIEFVWPFVKEIVLDKDAPKADRRKKGVAFTLVTIIVLFGSGAWNVVHPYVKPFLPPNQTSAPSQLDRTRWVRFLEDQMTIKVTEAAEVQAQLEATETLLEEERKRTDDLAKRIDELEDRLMDERAERSDSSSQDEPDLFDRMNELR